MENFGERNMTDLDYEIYEMSLENLKRKISPITNEEYKPLSLKDWENKDFEIKKMTDQERLGMRNFFSVDEKYLQKIQSIGNDIVIIFDDNIQCGGTLSDICEKLYENNVRNIIPITFGLRPQSWGRGNLRIPLNNQQNRTWDFGLARNGEGKLNNRYGYQLQGPKVVGKINLDNLYTKKNRFK